jgi:hypothetical protein
MPTKAELVEAGESYLGLLVSRHGGFREWARRLGVSTKSGREVWTDQRIESELRDHIKRFGYMPSFVDLVRSTGNTRLANKVAKTKGFRGWAEVLGVESKESGPTTGGQWEEHEELYWRSRGWTVERQAYKAPFDLLLYDSERQIRVDVKSARWATYDVMSGYVFSGLKRGQTCDAFDLVCISEDDTVAARFMVPARFARVNTITITKASLTGAGKYARFRI